MSSKITNLKDSFRSCMRVAASEAGKPIEVYLRNLFNNLIINENGEDYLNRSSFESCVTTVKTARTKFLRGQLNTIFDEIDGSGSGKISLNELTEFCRNNLSSSRTLALKLRNALINTYENEEGFKQCWSTIDKTGKFVDKSNFKDFIEENLKDKNTGDTIIVNENDALAVYDIFDANQDGKLSYDDFMCFVMAEQTVRATEMLGINNDNNNNMIVDVKIGTNTNLDSAILNQEYEHVTSTDSSNKKRSLQEGSFGRHTNLFILRRSKGTCGGRMKPIIDIQLESSDRSSAMVLAGYTRQADVNISGKYLWIKRAETLAEEDAAIVDLRITTGKISVGVDKIHEPPGSGSWLRVDGNFSKAGFTGGFDAFLWVQRSNKSTQKSNTVSPLKASLVMTDDTKSFKLCRAVRRALRNFIPISEIKNINTFFAEANEKGLDDAQNGSKRLYDFSSLYHTYGNAATNQMKISQFGACLDAIGASVDKKDVALIFYFFDADCNTFITREEFNHVIVLTDYEIDLCIERAKGRATKVINANPNDTKNNNYHISSPASSGSIRLTRVLSEVFKMCNLNGDGIISQNEIRLFFIRLDIFLTDDEARAIMKMMDIDHDDRVEEKDFIDFMRGADEVNLKLSRRVIDTSAKLRKWLQRGMSDDVDKTLLSFFGFAPSPPIGGDGQEHKIIAQVWSNISKNYTKRKRAAFPGYMVPSDFQVLAAILGVRQSHEEALALALQVAPDHPNRVYVDDLEAFMSRTVRNTGEVCATLEKGLLRSPCTLQKKISDKLLADGHGSPDLQAEFNSKVDQLVSSVKRATQMDNSSGNNNDGSIEVFTPNANRNNAPKANTTVDTLNHNRKGNNNTLSAGVVSISQLKIGIETSMPTSELDKYPGTNLYLNEEEWSCLATLTNSVVVGADSVGIDVKLFLQSLCQFIAIQGREVNFNKGQGIGKGIEVVCRDLQRMIISEAKANGGEPNFRAAFDLFDLDKQGTITLDEFHQMLSKLQLIDLVSDSEQTMLLKKFDKQNKGYITLEDFIAFASSSEHAGELFDVDDGFESDDDIGLSSNTPPAKITRSVDADWLLWHVYCQCCKIDSHDPEGVVTELGQACDDQDVTKKGCVSVRELWTIFAELNLRGQMTRRQYDDAMVVFTDNGTNGDQDTVDHDGLCRFIVRMGRAFNKIMQDRKKVDDKKYTELRAALVKELLNMGDLPTTGARGINNKNEKHVFRFESVMRRLDEDGDGEVSVAEFKRMLKRLRCKDNKSWGYRMIRRLFDELDTTRNGMLDVEEFKEFIFKSKPQLRATHSSSRGNKIHAFSFKDGNLSDEEDDDPVFSRRNAALNAISDTELLAKVTETLLELVPINHNSRSHIETVRAAVRRFFRKKDEAVSGFVPEERFRAFCRRSGLQDKLSAAELRRLISVHRQTNSSTGASISLKTQPLIDYNAFCGSLGGGAHAFSTIAPGDGGHTAAIGMSSVEELLTRLASAATASAASGRPFTSLCSLVDHTLSGRLSGEELIKTFRIMGAEVSTKELEILAEGLPSQAVTRDGFFDYRDVMLAMDKAHDRNIGRTLREGGVAAYTRASSGVGSSHDLHYNTNNMSGKNNVSRSLDATSAHTMATPAGRISTPSRKNVNLGAVSRSADFSKDTYMHDNEALHLERERMLQQLVVRVRQAAESRNESSSSLMQLFASHATTDYNGQSRLSLVSFKACLESLGVVANQTDAEAVAALLPGVTTHTSGNTSVDYGRFVRQVVSMMMPAGSLGSVNNIQSSNMSGGHNISPPYLSERVARRYDVLLRAAQDPLTLLTSADKDLSGKIHRKNFTEILDKLQLVVTEPQIQRACDDFADIHDRSQVRYEEYVDCLSQYARNLGYGNTGASRHLGNSNNYSNSSNSSGNDIMFDQANVNKWIRHASPQERRAYESVVESMQRHFTSTGSSYGGGGYNGSDEYENNNRYGNRYDDYNNNYHNNRYNDGHYYDDRDRNDRYSRYTSARDSHNSRDIPSRSRERERERENDRYNSYSRDRGRDREHYSSNNNIGRYDEERYGSRDNVSSNIGDDDGYWWQKNERSSSNSRRASPERTRDRDRYY